MFPKKKNEREGSAAGGERGRKGVVDGGGLQMQETGMVGFLRVLQEEWELLFSLFPHVPRF